MTVCIPLEAASPIPQTPSFLVPPSDPENQLGKLLKAILKAKRIAVVCGAGISVHAGIPDFRSPEGLFQTLKKENPKESLSSGRDLFDASVFNSESTTSLFCQMIAHLSELSQTAVPTPFHNLLRTLDDRGRLLRVYTQNIDALESKCGLSLGVPDYEDRRGNAWSPKSSGKAKATSQSSSSLPVHSPGVRLLSPPAETPRCIPLHGTLQRVHCQTCHHSFPLEDHLSSLSSGQPPACPECASQEETRQLVGKRSRGVGKLRPSVVLYNEDHREGEGVGEVVRKDLMGSNKGKGRAGADLLLVVGTSLRVPGTKRIVREFAKAVRARNSCASSKDTGLLTPSSTPPRRACAADEEVPMKSIYLNLDFPVPTREWEGVFDVWVKGDAQSFAQMLDEEIGKEDKAREAAAERKRKRDAKSARKDGLEIVDAEDEPIPVKRRKWSGASHSSKKKAKPTPTKSSTGKRITTGVVKKSLKDSLVTTKRSEGADVTPFTIKIPPRIKQPPVPEVCITTPVPRGKNKHTQLLSPSPSPPVGRAASHPKSPSKQKRFTVSKRKASVLGTPNSGPRDAHADDSDQDDSNELSDALLRTVQYGLRRPGG
ncbi:DHS-like NAD/FAD-binding domain-containing protein [Gloeophyllum trabeum ATCC 11539]|uniref:DHS-like NAD/FAD-binding domain-containing protein n=1 Tax=Gloeophyllum trabeum (strain ATCC 11539 / FP-39264 / Madison 617) TaxID=670483 RepID=S7RN74_GLOTA|nr:DHS-like NAD/FAD-binding domain-containing protein [Gloeophyllum trabeum ATCC 11539]EPQ54204.1 DHS-like NAD/FAD-binding domain-containing protein [Gloeophyllum trabeum ATCC 11539]